MMITNYPVYCYGVDPVSKRPCPERATYKIAAHWSDGQTHELKTYSLCCARCLPSLFESACQKQECCPLAADESLEKPAVFAWQPGTRDKQLSARPE